MNQGQFNSMQRILITFLRCAIGWHFLYEGWSKLAAGDWSAQYFLEGATGPLAPFYRWLAANPAVMQLVDLLNMYGLVLIGLGLFLGIVARYAALCGALLLTLYYFAYPPFGTSLLYQSGENLFIVNKQFIEAGILLIFFFLKDRGYGIDELVRVLRSAAHPTPESGVTSASVCMTTETGP
jgi:uncharacterized membrane protein YphA (DoxX/SURF4 family)